MTAQSNDSFISAMDAFAKQHQSKIDVIYGGDGSLVDCWQKHLENHDSRCIMPVRNYGMCQKHHDFYMKFFNNDEGLSAKMHHLPTLRASFDSHEEHALAEFTVTSADPTCAIRFNISLNGSYAAKDVIANGAVFAAKLGSTGYFKSIARTIFVEGIGIAFICPTYSLPNIVAKSIDRISFELTRHATLNITADKKKFQVECNQGWRFDVMDACDNAAILGYDMFMCQECRNNRNSTYVNDAYAII